MKKRWPQINFDGHPVGNLRDRNADISKRGPVVRRSSKRSSPQVASTGRSAVLADGLENGPLQKGLLLSDSSRLKADSYVFACGPWLGSYSPRRSANMMRATKQDIFFFGTPAGDPRFSDAHCRLGRSSRTIPVRHPGQRPPRLQDRRRHARAGFRSDRWRTSRQSRNIEGIREYLAFRFPALKDAPLIETRVCQYEQTPDSDFIIDRHPANGKCLARWAAARDTASSTGRRSAR